MNYENLNWQTLPEDMEARLLDFCLTEPDTNAVNFATMAAFGKIEFFQFAAPDYLVQWVRENIPLDDGHMVQLQVWKYTDQGKRHIDRKRDFSYNYLLMEHPGITRWFDDDGSQIDSVKYEHKKWYKHIGGEKYHDVIHVNNFRPAITIYKPVVAIPGLPVVWNGTDK